MFLFPFKIRSDQFRLFIMLPTVGKNLLSKVSLAVDGFSELSLEFYKCIGITLNGLSKFIFCTK